MRSIKILIAIGVIGVAVRFGVLALAPIQAEVWEPPYNPGLTGIFATNDALAAVTTVAVGVGPEHVACASDGHFYTGLEDGRVMRIGPQDRVETVANTGGRPLGIRMAPDGTLWIADSIKGIVSISPQGEVSQRLIDVDGEPMKFVDDLDVDAQGRVLFSDASQRFDFTTTLYDFFEGSRTGRLLRFDPVSGEVETLLEGLFFANGVTLGPDEQYVLINETGMGRIHRVWLAGDRQGEHEVFVDELPASPDNIRFDGESLFWVALPSLRDSLDSMAPYPWIRSLLSLLPAHILENMASPTSMTVAVNLDGEVVHNLQDSAKGFHYITGVTPCGDELLFGSLAEEGIGRLPMP